jgi:CHAT domain-containing protein
MKLSEFMALALSARENAIRQDARGPQAALNALGDECERLAAGTPQDALRVGETLATTARALHMHGAAARALRATIPALAYQGRFDEALVRADEATREALIDGDAIEAARAQVASLHALAKLGKTQEALRIGCTARDTLVAAGRSDLAARAELNLANIHKIRGETPDALAALERALSGIPESDATARGVTLNSQGEALFQLDRFDEAEVAFRAADRLLIEQPLARAVVAGNLADLLARQGRIGDALRVFDEVTRATKDVAPGHHARLEIDRAEALLAIGAFAEALDATERALATANGKGLKAEAARGTLVMARALLAASRFAEAETAVRRASTLVEELADVRGRRAVSIVASDLALARGDAQLALSHAIAAGAGTQRDTPSSTTSPLDVAQAETRFARAQLLESNAAAALSAAQRAADVATELRVDTLLLDATLVAADAARATSGVIASIAQLERAVVIAESTRATLAADQHRAAYAALSLRAYEDLALDLLAQGDHASLVRAFETTEKARSRTLLESMLRAIDRVPQAASTSVALDELTALRARLSALYATTTGNSTTSSGERRDPSTASNLATLEKTERALDALLARTETERGLRSLLAGPLDAVSIQARLSTDDVLLSFTTSGDELFAFVVTNTEITCVRAIAPMDELAVLIDKMLYLLRADARAGNVHANVHSIQALSRALYSAIIAPLLTECAYISHARRLVIIPCGALHALPFAMLDDGDQPLIERYEIQVAPSASIACAPLRAHRAPSQRAVVVAFADSAAPLIEEEALRVAHRYSTTPHVGNNARREHVRSAVANAQIVHLACHGRFVPSLPAASGLRLADGWLPIREIVDLEIDAELVFLSGCETGRHAVDAGEELAGLARAFHAAGARQLVTTLWSVRDAAALRVADAFHEHFSAGQRPSTALRHSILALRHESPHPSWWAPFVVSGVLSCA